MRNAIWLLGLGLLVTGAAPCSRGGNGDDEPGGGTVHGRECGDATCAVGQVCCNESCGICTPPGGVCTQQFCGDPDPDPGAPPSCGGIAGLDCPGSGMCEDDPNDDCDPENGGADCGGVCACNVLGLCVDGMRWDDDPSVCNCVRDTGGGGAGSGGGGDGVPCGPSTCAVGEVCCNESCGICTPPDGFCTEQFCGDPDPGPDPDPSGPQCGGIAGIDCPGAGQCVDDPSDDCDPENGGADCGGICTCSAAAVTCLAGVPFDDSPEVCACVEDGGGDGVLCGPNVCARGEVCCNESCGICTPPDGFCTDQLCDPGPTPGELCDMSCEPGNHCELVEVVCIRAPCNPVPECVPNVQCGGFAGFTCPGAGECVDDPNDDCDPNNGGADCGGFCTCSGALILCAPDTRLDTSPEVCECVRVDGGGGGERCGDNICPDGEVCCNASCGICTPPDGACIQIACL